MKKNKLLYFCLLTFCQIVLLCTCFEIIFPIINKKNKAMKRKMQIQKLQNNQIKVTVYVAKIDSLPGKVNNTYHGKGKMNKYFRFAVRDDQNEVLEFLAPEDFNLSGLLLSLPGEKLVLNLEVHMDDVENPTYELVQFENLTQTLENINDEIMELMDAGDL